MLKQNIKEICCDIDGIYNSLEVDRVEGSFYDKELLLKDIDRLKKKIGDVLDKKESFARIIPIFIMRRWSRGSLNKAVSKLSSLETTLEGLQGSLKVSDIENIKRELHLVFLWVHQSLSIVDTRDLIKQKMFSGNKLVKVENLEKGSVVLSYKTIEYLKKDLLSKLVAIATSSSITHSYIVASDDEGKIQLLGSSASGRGLNMVNPVPLRGEAYLVMTLSDRMGESAELLRREIDTWSKHALVKDSADKYKFSEIKSWIASLIGFVYVSTHFLFENPLTLKNPVKMNKEVFCSEIIDIMFKNAGVIVSPRCENDAVVGPVEFFHSPYLKLEGIIFNPEDEETMKKELIESFDLGVDTSSVNSSVRA